MLRALQLPVVGVPSVALFFFVLRAIRWQYSRMCLRKLGCHGAVCSSTVSVFQVYYSCRDFIAGVGGERAGSTIHPTCMHAVVVVIVDSATF